MALLICRAIPIGPAAEDIALHKIAFPNYGEPGWYRQMISLSNFQTGKQAGKVAQRGIGMGTCPWNHTAGILYSLKTEKDHERDMRIMLDSATEASPEVGAKLRAMFAAVPVIEHAGLYEFYDYIGFDRKARRYREIVQ